MTAICEWVIEFRDESEYNGYIRATQPSGKNGIVHAREWTMLAEGAYKECQGSIRAGTMSPRPLESCVKRVARILQNPQKHAHLKLQVRIRNVTNDEKIMGDLFI